MLLTIYYLNYLKIFSFTYIYYNMSQLKVLDIANNMYNLLISYKQTKDKNLKNSLNSLINRMNSIKKADINELKMIEYYSVQIFKLKFEFGAEDLPLIDKIVMSLKRFLCQPNSNQMQIEQDQNFVDNNYNYNYNNQIQEQTQTQVSKQKLKQLQDQKHSYNILGRIMSYAENYSYLNNPIKNYQKKYKYYDSFNASSKMSLEEYRDTFILQLIIFKSSFKNYEKKHGKYEFPEELSKEDLKAEIKMLKSNLKNHKDDKLYDSILSIIEGKDVNLDKFKHELDEIDNDGYHGKCNPQIATNYIPYIKYSVDSQSEKVEQKYLQNPNYKNKLKVNKNYPDFDYDNQNYVRKNKNQNY